MKTLKRKSVMAPKICKSTLKKKHIHFTRSACFRVNKFTGFDRNQGEHEFTVFEDE